MIVTTAVVVIIVLITMIEVEVTGKKDYYSGDD